MSDSKALRRRLTRRDFLKSAAGATGAIVLAACAPPATPGPSSAPATESAATSAPAAQPTSAPTQAALAPSGQLTIAQGIDPRSLWSNSSTTQQEINVSEQITEKLFEFSADASEFEPRLATEWEQIDDTTLRMKLREGVNFTNGEEFDAESAKSSIEVMLEAPSYAFFVASIAGAEVVDKYTVDIKTKNPTLLHMPALAMGSFQYPAKYFAEVGSDGFGQSPIGTGPYKFVDWVKDSHITLEANPDYWAGPPAMETVIFRNIPEGAAKLAALEAGEVDFIIDVPLDAVERVENNTDLQLFSRPSNRMFYLTGSTLSDSPIKNPAVRRALWYAVDVDALIQGLFKGRATRLNGQILVPGFFGYDPDRKPTPYEPEKAIQMLADAGYPDGFEITFKYPAGRYAQDKEAGQAIAAQLAKVGIQTNQEVLEPGTFLDQLVNLELNDLYFGGSLPPPDAHFMFTQFQTGFRYSYYSNPKFDELLQKGATTADREERIQIYKQIMDIFDEDPPYVPLYRPEDYYAGTQSVSGFTPRASQFLDVRAIKLT
jgi:peptide/nickel transport system substrate-binding protein